MPRRYLTVKEQRTIVERAKGCCEYCQSQMQYAAQPFVFEHITPISQGGQSTLGNLALACGGCNGHKYNKTEASDPVDGSVVPLYNPRQHHWVDHFAWDEDYTLVIGLTAMGRATVETLKLNRPGVINMRKLLITVGKHPPSKD